MGPKTGYGSPRDEILATPLVHIMKKYLAFPIMLPHPVEDSSWLRVQDKEIFSKRGLKHRATKERGFQEHARKIFSDLHEANMMHPRSFFVEVDLLKTKQKLFCVQKTFWFLDTKYVFLSCISVGCKLTYKLHCHFTCNTLSLSLHLSGVQDKTIPVLQLL